jgi:nucleoside 2-deoxyribosyltransferase
MLVYIAAPLFTDAERTFNYRLCAKLSEFLDCYLPQRDGVLLADAVLDGADRKETSRIVFDCDISAIHRANFVIAVLDGAEVDAGVAVEIGVSWALGKSVFGLRTDSRRPVCGGLNPMIEGACSGIATSIEDLVHLVSVRAVPQAQ